MERTHDHVVVQLGISSSAIDDIIRQDGCKNMMNDMASRDPAPYQTCDYFESQHVQLGAEQGHAMDCHVPSKSNGATRRTVKASNDSFSPIQHTDAQEEFQDSRIHCFWCCHDIGASRFGMPVAYDAVHNSFSMYGHFCSLECCAAYNFATHMGCDRMWEIHTWIQLYARQTGYGTPVRPAPNRYLLKMFGGPMTVDEFRQAHKGTNRTVVLNIPPLINVQSQVESINTSFLFKAKPQGVEGSEGTLLSTSPNQATHVEKSKLMRKKSIMDQNRTLDVKMNLSYQQLEERA